MFAVKAAQLTISISKLGNNHISCKPFSISLQFGYTQNTISILQVTYSRFLSLGDYIYFSHAHHFDLQKTQHQFSERVACTCHDFFFTSDTVFVAL
jgi:hypothetical protein